MYHKINLPSLLLLCLLLTICIAPAAASSPYADLLQDPSRSTEDKLADFADALGWRDELGTYWMEMENYEMQIAQQQAEIQQAQELQEAAAALGLDISSTVESALESIATTAPPYTAEELAALDAESAAYYSAFAANYVATVAFTGSGSGTQGDPYIITNRAQLEAMADDLTAYYQLGNDIDLGGSGSPWTPIGSQSAPFGGTLDGNGYTISNMYVSSSSESSNIGLGLFGFGGGCTITDLAISAAEITYGSATTYVVAAPLVAQVVSGVTIERCSADCDISITGETSSSYSYVIGGLLGNSVVTVGGTTVSDCVATGSITSASVYTYAGGIFAGAVVNSGAAWSATNTYTSVDITVPASNNRWVGGAVGNSYGNVNLAMVLQNVVILASDVSGGTNTKRVWSRSYVDATAYANAAMLLNGNTVSGGTTADQNGADVSASTYNTQAFWETTLGWDFVDTWYWDTTTNLPKLRAFIHGPTISSVSATPTTGGTTTQITLSATVQDATSYQWQYSTNSGGNWQDITGATSATATWTPGAVGTYQVQLLATNSDGTTTSDTISITIYAAPTVSSPSVSPAQGPITQQITLSGSATDPASSVSPTTYQWQQASAETGPWTPIDGATTATYQYSFSGSAGTTYYRLAATGVGGTGYSSAVSYTAYDAPTVSSPSVTPTQGPLTQQLTLSATVSDPASTAAPTTYQWQQYTEAAWQEIPGATTATYQYSFSGTAGTYQFRLAATGVGGTAYSDAVTYTAYNAPAFSTATVTPQTGPYPLQVTYTAQASDTTSYTWEMSANSGGSWDQISTTATGQYTHQTAGTYQWKVTATGPGGTTTSSIITVTVTTPPPVFSTVSVSPTQGPLAQQWTLTAQASDTETYQWQSAPQGTDSWTNIATGASATYTYPDGTEPGPYQIRCIATGPGGSTTSDPIQIDLLDLVPIIDNLAVSPQTGGISTQFTLSATVQDADSMQWQYSANSGGSWQDITGATAATATWTPGTVGTYQVRLQAVNTYGTTTSDTISITIYAAPTVSSPSVSPAQGPITQQITLSATVSDPASAAAPTTYQWQQYTGSAWQNIPGATTATYQYSFSGTAGTYQFRLAATGVGGTAYSDAVTYTAYNAPTVSSPSVSPTEGPLSQQLTLTATVSDPASSAAPTTYQWQQTNSIGGDWTPIPGATTQTYQYAFSGTAGTTYYRLAATGVGGTGYSSAVTYTAYAAPVFSSTTVTPTSGQMPLTVSYSAAASDATTYQWQYRSGTSGNWQNLPAGASGQYTFSSVGTYQMQVTATGIGGSTTSSPISITVEPPVPVITSATVTPTSGAVPLTVQMSASATNSPTYEWQLWQNDGWTTVATGATASYTFGQNVPTGQYILQLLAENVYGADSEQFTISIVGFPTVEITEPISGSEYEIGRPVTFTATGADATSFVWYFGDGGSAVGQSVQHTYQSLGDVTVEVVGSNAAGSVSDTVDITIVEAADILLTVSDISSKGALLTGQIEVPPVPTGTEMWFEVYSASGQLVWQTDPVVCVGDTAELRVEGMPLLSGQSYFARAFADGYAPSLREPMQLLSAVQVPYETMGVQWDAGLNREPFNISAYVMLGPSVFGDVMGGGSLGVAIAVGVLMMFILVALWLRQQDVIIPLILGLITSFTVLALVPPEFKAVGYTLLIISLVGIIWQVFKNR